MCASLLILEVRGADNLQGPLSREAAMELERKKKAGLLTDDDMSRLTVVSMAGVVSEYIRCVHVAAISVSTRSAFDVVMFVDLCTFRFGSAEGGYGDLVQLEVLQTLQNPYMSEREAEEQVSNLAPSNIVVCFPTRHGQAQVSKILTLLIMSYDRLWLGACPSAGELGDPDRL